MINIKHYLINTTICSYEGPYLYNTSLKLIKQKNKQLGGHYIMIPINHPKIN
mgnify:CR=1 FL=1